MAALSTSSSSSAPQSLTLSTSSSSSSSSSSTSGAVAGASPADELSGLSPREYKERIRVLTEQAEALRAQLQKLADCANQVQHTGAVRDSFLFSDAVADFGVKPGGTYGKQVVLFGETLNKIESSRRQLLDGMDASFSKPVASFIETEVLELSEYRDRAVSAKEEFDAAQLKYDVSRTSASVTAKQERSLQELEEAKRRYELADLAYVNKLIEIQARKDFQVVERLCTVMFAYSQFYTQSAQALKAIEPVIKTTMTQLVSARNDYSEGRNRLDVESLLAKKLASKPDASIKQGHLLVKKRGGWNRRWFVVTDGQMFMYKNWKNLEPIQAIDLLLCSVKKVPDPDRQDCFMLISPEIQMTLQALGPKDLDEWIYVIQEGIGFQLKKRQKDKEHTTVTDSSEKFNYLAELRDISPVNRVCADCDDPNPEWGLMNLGVLICYQCSGVHRSLGVHISKVRSLTLDKWEPELYNIIKTVGNDNSNKIWEARLAESTEFQKITSAVDRTKREAFIRAKYEHHKFVQTSSLTGEQQEAALREACDQSDLLGIMNSIAQGVNLNHLVGPPAEKRTLLHHVVLEGKTSTYCLELLIQSGAKLYSMDARGWTPLHYAAERDLVSYSRLLVLRGASVTADDRQGVTPMSLATSNNSEQVLRLFRGELNDVVLPVFPADEKNLKAIKESFGDHVEVVKSKLNLLRQELAAATTVDSALEIMKKIRILKLTLYHVDEDEEDEE